MSASRETSPAAPSATQNTEPLTASSTIKLEELTNGNLIGEGGFGKVYKYSYRGHTVALKHLIFQGYSQIDSEMAKKEIEITAKIQSLSSPYLITAFKTDPPTDHFIVMEYMAKGSVAHQVHNNSLSWGARYRYMHDSAEGLAALHRGNILHADFKPMNIFVGENGAAKIGDFGSAYQLKNENHCIFANFKSTLAYASPDQLERITSKKSDIYNLGVSFWEIATKKIPYEGFGSSHVLTAIQSNQKPGGLVGLPAGLGNLIHACWQWFPNLRPTAEDCVAQINAVIASDTRALLEAAELGETETVRFLLAHRANPTILTPLTGLTALSWASNQGHIGVVQVMLDSGIEGVTHPNADGTTALAKSKSLEIFALLRKKIKPTEADKKILSQWLIGYTKIAHKESIKILLAAGIDINTRDQKGNTPLIVACLAGNKDLVRFLLDNGADPAIFGEGNLTAAGWASEEKHSDIVEIIKRFEREQSTSKNSGTLLQPNTFFNSNPQANAATTNASKFSISPP